MSKFNVDSHSLNIVKLKVIRILLNVPNVIVDLLGMDQNAHNALKDAQRVNFSIILEIFSLIVQLVTMDLISTLLIDQLMMTWTTLIIFALLFLLIHLIVQMDNITILLKLHVLNVLTYVNNVHPLHNVLFARETLY